MLGNVLLLSDESTLQLGLQAVADYVKHCLLFATWTLVSHCKTPLFAAGCAVVLLVQKWSGP